jgi:guanosine-3',5'-bis(diphosphate) 3'-pyrophosphohydrolase
MKKLDKCFMVSDKVHAGQSYDIFPYSYHIRKTVLVSQHYGFDEAIQCACALHDSMEDGNLSYNDIKTYFGIEIAEIVFAVTDELGRNRKERKAKTYPKIRANWKAVAVKLCDRIANIEHSKEYTPNMLEMYRKEHSDFKTSLFNPDHPEHELSKLWDHIETLLK